MQVSNKKYRIKDIARMAGVSEGTVDRVLHNRGEVSEKSKEAIQKVLDEINYSPNLLARSLASKKHYHFICMIPSYQKGDYWEFVETAFRQAGADFLQYNIHIDIRYFNQFDIESFGLLTNDIIQLQPNAVIIAPIFRNETLAFTQKLLLHEIPFSFIDSLIEDSGYTTYYGQNSYQSGYVAAKLLLNDLPEHSKILIVRTKRLGAISNQTKSRYEGFMAYLEQQGNSTFSLVSVEISEGDDASNLQHIENIFNNNKGIHAAITFNSKVYKLANYLNQLNKNEIRLIGYDLLEQNVEYLRQGVISFLIAQSPGKQAYYTVRDLCNTLILKQEVSQINYVPIDILITENITDYINFREKY